MNMTGDHHKASLKRNEQQSDSETDEHSDHALASRSSTDVPKTEFIPA